MKNKNIVKEYEEMSRTEYLFGVPPSYFKYQELFARERIAQAKKIKTKMASMKMRGYTEREIDAIHYRYGSIEEAEMWSKKLLSEALGELNGSNR